MIEAIVIQLLAKADSLVAAGNFTIVILALTVAAAAGYQLITRTYQSDLKFILVGIMFSSFGWTLHRAYYGVVRAFAAAGVDITDWLFGTAVPMIPVCFIVMGKAILLTPLWKQLTGIDLKWWQVVGSSWLLYWLIYVILEIIV